MLPISVLELVILYVVLECPPFNEIHHQVYGISVVVDVSVVHLNNIWVVDFAQ